jgi:hypothetical protein
MVVCASRFLICSISIPWMHGAILMKQDGATLMHYAVQTACNQTIKTLLLYNVDINRPDDVCWPLFFWFFLFFLWVNCFNLFNSQYGWTPLHLAVQTQRTDIVRLLLLKGADRTLKTQVSIFIISCISQMIKSEHIMPCLSTFMLVWHNLLISLTIYIPSSVFLMIHL